MGSSSREWEQKPLIKELTQGRDFTRQLQTHFQQSSPHQGLVLKILSSFNKALSMLNQPADMEGEPQQMGPDATSTESPRSVSGSPSSDNSDQAIFKDQERRDISKKRKTLPKWTEQVRVCSGTGLEGPLDDGYSWRKYGQKDILGAKYPRGYYRCTYRNVRGCLATKQVQRSDEDPTIFDVTYSGKHTCFHSSHALVRPSSSSPPKQIEQQQQPQEETNAILLNFRSGLKVKTEDLDSPFSFPPASLESSKNPETGHYLFSSPTFENNTSNSLLESLSPPFISPATSESNYFPVSPCRMNSTFTPATSESNYLSASPMSSFMGAAYNVQGSESDLTEIFSASTSVTNSPMMDLDFTLEPLEFDPNFPFDASFFS